MAEKIIEGFENYTIDEDGNVFSKFTNKYLKHSVGRNGYLMVELFNDKVGKMKLVHRLVAEAFIPNPNHLPQVNHKDENKQNPCVNNLEWCDAKYNMNYGVGAVTRHKNIDYSKPIFKECMKKAYTKLKKGVEQYNQNGVLLNTFESITKASECTGISGVNIGRCANHKRKTAGGFIWKHSQS